MPDSFNDIAKLTRSHILAANTPARLEIPRRVQTASTRSEHALSDDVAAAGHAETPPPSLFVDLGGSAAEAMTPQRKRGRPLGKTDSQPRKRRVVKANRVDPVDPMLINTETLSHEIISDYSYVHDLGDALDTLFETENKEISIDYADVHDLMERTSTYIDDAFAYAVAQDIMGHDDVEPRLLLNVNKEQIGLNGNYAIQVELDSLTKRKVFGPVLPTSSSVKPVGYKWVFVRKRNEKNEVLRYKA